MARRTCGTVETTLAAMLISGVRMQSVPPMSVRCAPFSKRTSGIVRSASAASAWALFVSMPSFSACHAKARYIAPVSRCRMPNRLATSSATLLLPAPTGPSIAMVRTMFPSPLLLIGQMARCPRPIHTSSRCPRPILKNTATATCSPERAMPIFPPTLIPSALGVT